MIPNDPKLVEARKILARASLNEWKAAGVNLSPVDRQRIAKAHGLTDDAAREVVAEIFGK